VKGAARVIIGGGGPVGLLTALALGRAGVNVTLFEQGDILHQEPRAATIHPASLDLLDDLGVYERIEPLGLIAPIVHYWDRAKHELVAAFDHAVLAGETRHPWVLQCEQNKVSRVLFEMTSAMANIQIRTNAKVVRCSQTSDNVNVVVRLADGPEESHRCDYLVGADGAKSTVRGELGVAFEGFTYPERFIVVGTPYDFAREGYALRNYMSDPDEWANLFKISWNGPPGIWRIVVPARPHEDRDTLRREETAQEKLQRFCPRDEPYEIALMSQYTVDQRVAATFRVGRILLAGDAAHLNSPIGGMGMNSGIHDALNLVSNLTRVISGEEDEGALDRYVRQRRYVAINHVQTTTLANKQNMEQRDPEKRREYFDGLRRAAADPALAKKFLMRTALIDSLRDVARIQ
jgi:3-(3-hydroxy-phenyl)propionate hydroxylase